MGRSSFSALTLVLLAVAGIAIAQTVAQFNVGAREVGAVHPLTLTARNDNCPQNLNFRFDFAPSDWLRPRGDNRVRDVPSGQSRPLPALIDLTHMQPGRHTAEVDVVCENCQFLRIRNCGFDRQHLTISVEAIAAAAAAEPATAPTTVAPVEPTPPPRRDDPAPAPQPAPTIGATLLPPPSPSPAAEPACNCAPDPEWLRPLAAIAGGAALLGIALAVWGFSAAQSARAAADAARTVKSPDSDARQFLQDKAEELQELCENSRADLKRLLNAQLQAMRALSALSLIDRNGLASESDAWTATAYDAGYSVDEKSAALVAGRSGGALLALVDATFGVAPDGDFTLCSATIEAARADHRQRLAWLRRNGFADSDEAAQAALNEMANYMTYGASMRDMNERLKELAAECLQNDIDLARFVATAGGG